MVDRPFIAGVGGGVGTTTVATALYGRDCGIYRAHRPVQVLVCRSTLHSVGCAQDALQYVPVPPVLVVVDDVPGGATPRNTLHRLRTTEPWVYGVVRIPFVGDWRDVAAPYDQAAQVLTAPGDQPRGLRSFTDAVQELVDAIVSLQRDTDPWPQAERLPASGAG